VIPMRHLPVADQVEQQSQMAVRIREQAYPHDFLSVPDLALRKLSRISHR